MALSANCNNTSVKRTAAALLRNADHADIGDVTFAVTHRLRPQRDHHADNCLHHAVHHNYHHYNHHHDDNDDAGADHDRPAVHYTAYDHAPHNYDPAHNHAPTGNHSTGGYKTG
ncbi:hypothetical protein RR48_06915 [Papilio machaon]|uniref:Uncharacterized protein n=1 Tax=Papilio machaon TaxID=76193 RepID=A0A194RFN3_PAPMA|nr:hypothetical protein RR48_06915 [Papilio machaon]